MAFKLTNLVLADWKVQQSFAKLHSTSPEGLFVLEFILFKFIFDFYRTTIAELLGNIFSSGPNESKANRWEKIRPPTGFARSHSFLLYRFLIKNSFLSQRYASVLSNDSESGLEYLCYIAKAARVIYDVRKALVKLWSFWRVTRWSFELLLWVVALSCWFEL